MKLKKGDLVDIVHYDRNDNVAIEKKDCVVEGFDKDGLVYLKGINSAFTKSGKVAIKHIKDGTYDRKYWLVKND